MRGEKAVEDWGAGDQGLIFGYATDEWDNTVLHPYSHYLANKLCEKMAEVRKNGTMPWLRPDCKSQVVLEYSKDHASGKLTPLRAHNVLISTQHDPAISNDEIAAQVTTHVIRQVIPATMLRDDTRIVINPTGKFDVGGPAADAGLTGRKIIVDTYGGWAPHGGGAFSGKDPSKTDRSAGYFTRYVAKSLVAAGLAHRALVQVAYAIGLAEPMSIHVESYGSARHGLTDADLLRIVKENFSFRPGNMIQELNLKRPMYQQTAAFGAFGREPSENSFPWEQPKDLSHVLQSLNRSD